MKIEKFEEWHRNKDHWAVEAMKPESRPEYYCRSTWFHQQWKIDDILDYISLIGHQKELDRFLKQEKGWE